MLRAIVNGKAGRLPPEIKPGDSWRHVFRTAEDLLTASVFERLAYLDGTLLWEILRTTFRPGLPPRRVVELDEIEFWPTWSDATGSMGQDVEPDVVLKLSVGDPPRRVALIVECKTGAGRQYPEQWAREWLGFKSQSSMVEPPDELWLLALGGLPESPTKTIAQFTKRISEEKGFDINALADDWTDLSRALDEIELSDRMGERIVEDIRAALELDGYRTIRPMGELAAYAARYAMGHESGAILRLRPQTGPTEAVTGVMQEGTFCAMGEMTACSMEYRTDPASALVLNGWGSGSSIDRGTTEARY